jgi:hypothetical protein
MASLQVDMVDTLAYAYSQGLDLYQKCPLEALVTGGMPLQIANHNTTIISVGMLMIFPSLEKIVTISPTWARLGGTVKALG